MHDGLSLRAIRQNAGFNLLFHPSQTEYGLFPNNVVAAREWWLKDARNRRIAVDFLRALNEGQQLARENAQPGCERGHSDHSGIFC